jgi:hypothetical protein
MLACPLGEARPAKHPRNLLDARFSLELVERCPGRTTLRVLGDAELPISLHRHLGEMRDAQHLAGVRERGELPSDHLRDRTPDTCVDLVEDKAGPAVAP